MIIPNSEGRPEDPDALELREVGGKHIHTDKWRRCVGHVKRKSPGYEPHAVCTASIGYAGSYTGEHRQGARTPAGRQRKLRRSSTQT